MIQYLGLLMVLISWAAGGYLLTKWRSKELRTISTHASSAKPALWLFASVLVVGGGIFYAWLAFWLAPRLGLGAVYQVLVGLTYLSQAATALVPDTPGRNHEIHHFVAYTMATLFLPLAWWAVAAPKTSLAAQIIGVTGGSYMTLSFLVVIILGRYHQQFLKFQISYIATLQLVVLAAAYL
jgi:hypothetical protein